MCTPPICRAQTQETYKLISTIVTVQPKRGSAGVGKTNDELAFDLADSILSKLPDKLDMETVRHEFFEPDSKGRLDSLTTVLMQEVDRYNKLLKVVKVGEFCCCCCRM